LLTQHSALKTLLDAALIIKLFLVLAGLGLSNTNYARVLETLCTDPAIAVTLMAHQSIGLKVTKNFVDAHFERKLIYSTQIVNI
jgi:hypothetical protein